MEISVCERTGVPVAGISGANGDARTGGFRAAGRPLEGSVVVLVYLHRHIGIEYDTFCLGKIESSAGGAIFLRFGYTCRFSFS